MDVRKIPQVEVRAEDLAKMPKDRRFGVITHVLGPTAINEEKRLNRLITALKTNMKGRKGLRFVIETTIISLIEGRAPELRVPFANEVYSILSSYKGNPITPDRFVEAYSKLVEVAKKYEKVLGYEHVEFG